MPSCAAGEHPVTAAQRPQQHNLTRPGSRETPMGLAPAAGLTHGDISGVGCFQDLLELSAAGREQTRDHPRALNSDICHRSPRRLGHWATSNRVCRWCPRWRWENTAEAWLQSVVHDLRHTTAARLAADPDITLVEIQTIMRHAHLTTTQIYTPVGLDDLIDKLAEHYARPQPQPQWSATSDPEDVRTVFGA
jgi:hypothetical protein